MDEDETTPLLASQEDEERLRTPTFGSSSDPHTQFCTLIGIQPSKSTTRNHGDVQPHPSSSALYSRATYKRRTQSFAYAFTAALSNSLLLSQIILGATLTALGASESSHVLITIFGVLNTVIAGLVAYLKSRGQPMRARMFRDDLEHVVDEIENSEIMWMGITKGIHGYDEIDVDDKVSVRSEVARLTRLYETAVKSNRSNNPDMYMAGSVLDAITGLRTRPAAGGAGIQVPAIVPSAEAGIVDAAGTTAVVPPAAGPDTDESPATSNDTTKPDTNKAPADLAVGTSTPDNKDGSAPPTAGTQSTKGKTDDFDSEPASVVKLPKKEEPPNGAKDPDKQRPSD